MTSCHLLSIASQARLNLGLKKLALLKHSKHGSGATTSDIRESEHELDVVFPDVMRKFLRRVGWVMAGDFVVFGLGKDVPPKLHLTRKALAWQASKKHSIPRGVIPLSGDIRANAPVLDLRPASPTYGAVLYHDFTPELSIPHGDGDEIIIPSTWKDYLTWLNWEIEGALQAQEEEALYKKLEKQTWKEF